jgi:hypothetical protein
MKPRPLKIGDIVQIDPEHDEMFGACLMIVTEPKEWGAQGYVRVPGNEGGNAFYRCKYENMELVGFAEWVRAVDEEVQ